MLTETTRRGKDGAHGYALSGFIPTNDNGTADTIGYMSALAVDAAAHDPVTREVAKGILADADHTVRGTVQAIYNFIAGAVRFRGDPKGREVLRTPEQTLLEIARTGNTQEDCKKNSTLGVALLLAAGIPAAFITVGRRRGAPFSHVMFAAYVDREWYPLDPQEGRQGYIPGHAIRRQLWEVRP